MVENNNGQLNEVWRNIYDLDKRISVIEEKLDMIIEQLQDLRNNVEKRNGLVKWTITVYVSTLIAVLSFVAAMFHMGWKP